MGLLLAIGALGDMAIFWDALKFKCLDIVLESFLVIVKLEQEEGFFLAHFGLWP